MGLSALHTLESGEAISRLASVDEPSCSISIRVAGVANRRAIVPVKRAISHLPVLTARVCTLIASRFAFPSSASPDYTNRGPLWVAGFWGQRMVRQLFQTPTGSRQAMQTIRPALTTTRCSMRRV
jgi:hypothetical protein